MTQNYIYTSIKKKKTITKIEMKVGMHGVQKRILTRVVRMVTKVKGRPYFFLSSVFGCLFSYQALVGNCFLKTV